MNFTNLRTFYKFLSRNKLYTFVSIFGFSISLMFVILLSIYVKQELSVDDFQEKKDRIYLAVHDKGNNYSNPSAELIKDNFPDVESFTRIKYNEVMIKYGDKENASTGVIFVDSTFFNTFSYKLIEGDPKEVFASRLSMVVSKNYANTISPNKSPVGMHMYIGDIEHTVTGVMENMPTNSIIKKQDILINYSTMGVLPDYGGKDVLENHSQFGFTIFFLEKKGANLPAKGPEVTKFMKEETWFFKDGFTDNANFVPIKKAYYDKRNLDNCLNKNDRTVVAVYTGIAILILIIATLNYINMTMAQSSFRGKEAAIRRLIGGDRKNIIMQILSESLVLTLGAFAIGLLLALACEPFFDDVLSTQLALYESINIEFVLASIVFIIVISFVSGIVPATVISSFSPIEVVKGTFMRKVKSKYSKILIVFQYFVAITLLICSFFIMKQSSFLVNYDMGFNKERIMILQNVLTPEQLDGFKSKLYSMSGVELVSYSKGVPLGHTNNQSFSRDGQQFSFQEIYCDSTFFEIYGITVQPTGVAVTDETKWVNQVGYDALQPDPVTFIADFGWEKVGIVGILNDFNYRSLHEPLGMFKMGRLKKNDWPWNITVKINNSADFYATAKDVEKTYQEYNGGKQMKIMFADEEVENWYAKEKKTSKIMAAFTILTIIISVMGVFAMSMYMVRQKEKEIGIRKVNGATDVQILGMLNIDSIKLVMIAFALACPLGYYVVNRWFEQFPYRTEITPIGFLLAGGAILVLTVLSVSGMTWKAARTNPIESLNRE